MTTPTDIHSCSYFCTRPACVLAQRDELRDSHGAGNQVPPTAQPAAQPVQRLSDERIDFLADRLWEEGHIQSLSKDSARIFARAIEAALQPQPTNERDDLVNGLMGSTITETVRADAAEAAIESIVELLDQHADDMHVKHGCRPSDAVCKARDIAIAALPARPGDAS